MLFRLISRAIAAMSSPCASTSAPTTRWGARREQPRVRRGQQTAAALEAYQLRGCELPGWPLPARQVLPERDTKPLFVCLRLLAQRGLRLGAAGERLSALHTYCAAQQKTHVFRVLLRRSRALHRVQAPVRLIRVARQAQRLVIPAQRAFLVPWRAVRRQRARTLSRQRATQAKTQGRRLTSPPFQAARRAAARDNASCASPPAQSGELVRRHSEASACAAKLRSVAVHWKAPPLFQCSPSLSCAWSCVELWLCATNP